MDFFYYFKDNVFLYRVNSFISYIPLWVDFCLLLGSVCSNAKLVLGHMVSKDWDQNENILSIQKLGRIYFISS